MNDKSKTIIEFDPLNISPELQEVQDILLKKYMDLLGQFEKQLSDFNSERISSFGESFMDKSLSPEDKAKLFNDLIQAGSSLHNFTVSYLVNAYNVMREYYFVSEALQILLLPDEENPVYEVAEEKGYLEERHHFVYQARKDVIEAIKKMNKAADDI